MSSNIVKNITNIYYITLQYLVAILLSAFKSQEQMHSSMTNIVNNFLQL